MAEGIAVKRAEGDNHKNVELGAARLACDWEGEPQATRKLWFLTRQLGTGEGRWPKSRQ